MQEVRLCTCLSVHHLEVGENDLVVFLRSDANSGHPPEVVVRVDLDEIADVLAASHESYSSDEEDDACSESCEDEDQLEAEAWRALVAKAENS